MRSYPSIIVLIYLLLLTGCSSGSGPVTPGEKASDAKLCEVEWGLTWGGTGMETSYCTATGPDGSIYATGSFMESVDFDPGGGVDVHHSAGHEDVSLVKFSQDGIFQWARTWGGPGTDGGSQMAVDGDGNVYVTGWCMEECDFDPGEGVDKYQWEGANDIFLCKYDSEGNYQWARMWGGPGWDSSHGIAISPTGDIYLGTEFWFTVDLDPSPEAEKIVESKGGPDACLSRFTPEGELVWVKTWGGAGGDGTDGLVFDTEGNLYMTGDFSCTVDFDTEPGVDEHTSNGERDCFLIKYDNADNYLWGRTWGAGGERWDKGNGIDVDGDGNVYVTGFFKDAVNFDLGRGEVWRKSQGCGDIFLCRFDPAGNLNWVRTWGSADWDTSIETCVDREGNVLVTGFFKGVVDFDPGAGSMEGISEGAADIFLSCFDTAGELKWLETWGGTGWDAGWGIVNGVDGSVYLTGAYKHSMETGTSAWTSAGDADGYLFKLTY